MQMRKGNREKGYLIGSDAEPKHWLDRERTKFQINFSCRRYRMLVGYRENQP